jgi:hypothetical protein
MGEEKPEFRIQNSEWRRRLRRWSVWLLAGVCATLLAAQRDSDRQLEAAIYREVVAGDLKGAIEQYRGILAAPHTPREIAARALLQMGECYDKLGQRRQAHDAYTRVTREFESLTAVASEARGRLDRTGVLPGPHNLRFEEGEPGEIPPGWFVPSMENTTGKLAELHRTGCRSRVGCMVLTAPATATGAVGYGHLMQSFSAAAYRGRTVRLRAWLKVEPSAPGDRAHMWLHVSGPNQKPGLWADMDQRPDVPKAPGDAPKWESCELTGRVDQDAQFLEFSFASIGHGRVWIDSVSFEVVD